MGKLVDSAKDMQQFTTELVQMLADAGYDMDIVSQEYDDQRLQYILHLNVPSQYGRVFKVPNLIYYNLSVEGSDIYDASGVYEDWLLVVPNK